MELESRKRERAKWENLQPSNRNSRTPSEDGKEFEESDSQEVKPAETSWDPPKVMTVNQLWIWIIDGGGFPKVLDILEAMRANSW
jgi:hypothetical protein